MNYPPDVTEILNALLAGVQQVLGRNLVGVYLRGSLALGEFRPETSDVDVLAVTEQPIGAAEFAALAALHAQLASLPNPYARRVEMAYLDRVALRRYRPGLHHATLGQNETLKWSEHHTNWILERWAVREHGVALTGPQPQTLIDPIAPDELCQAVRARLGDWAEWAQKLADAAWVKLEEPEWLAPRRSMAAYVVETMCRALYTLACAELASKQRAVAWALDALPEPQRATVARSQQWRTDRTSDPSIVPEVIRFVLWAAAYVPDSARGQVD
jgi:predicted nucleotidyltransferase